MTFAVNRMADEDVEAAVALWHEVDLTRPWNDPHRDLARARETWPDLVLAAHDGPRLVGTVVAGFDGHRGWLYYLATVPDRQGEGIASTLVSEAERRLSDLGCPKVQLMVRADNAAVLEFYDRRGYERSDVVVTGKRLIPDD